MPIQVEHLTHTYLPGSPFSATAVHDLNLTIEDGEFVGVLGHTGSGKTTFVQHLNGLLKPTEGRVLVDGVDITQKGVKLLDVRKKVGLVFQYPEYQLFEETVAKDVAFGPKNMGLTKTEIEERVNWALAQVELDRDKVGNCSPFELSGGQMRRVAIAGVLAMKPECIVLDEATAMLDPIGRSEVISTIERLNRDEGITVVLITHHLNEAEHADRVIVMNEGRVAMDGAPREVFAQVEKLKSIGLTVPDTVELLYELRGAGCDLPLTAITVDECADAIARCFGKSAKEDN